MIIILAHAGDAQAARLGEAWRVHDARLMTPRDLSASGWRWYWPEAEPEYFVAGGERISVSEIEAVITRVHAVGPNDLPHIAAEDRDYVAREMTAFLTAWLHRGPFIALNRPGDSSLMGPSLRSEQWHLAAVRAGLPLATRMFHSTVEPARQTGAVTITVIGKQVIGDVAGRLAEGASRLAEMANVDVLSVALDGRGADAKFIGANLWPDVGEPAIADALHQLVIRRRSEVA